MGNEGLRGRKPWGKKLWGKKPLAEGLAKDLAVDRAEQVLSRRSALQALLGAGAGFVVAGCTAPEDPTKTKIFETLEPTEEGTPTPTPAKPSPSKTPESSSPTPEIDPNFKIRDWNLAPDILDRLQALDKAGAKEDIYTILEEEVIKRHNTQGAYLRLTEATLFSGDPGSDAAEVGYAKVATTLHTLSDLGIDPSLKEGAEIAEILSRVVFTNEPSREEFMSLVEDMRRILTGPNTKLIKLTQENFFDNAIHNLSLLPSSAPKGSPFNYTDVKSGEESMGYTGVMVANTKGKMPSLPDVRYVAVTFERSKKDPTVFLPKVSEFKMPTSKEDIFSLKLPGDAELTDHVLGDVPGFPERVSLA